MAELAIFVSSLFFLIIGINQFPLRNWDEAWYAQVIKDMISGKYGYLMPHWNGEYFFDKPPLYFWLNFPIIKLFGMGEWQFRILSVILTAFSAMLIYKIGKELMSNRSAFLSALIFLIFGQVKERLSTGNTDGLLVFQILLSIYLFQKSTKSKKYLLPAMLSWGLIALSKSWLYFLIFPLFTYPFIDPKYYQRHLKYLPLALLIALSWYFFAAMQFGKPFTDWYLLYKGAFGLPKINASLFLTLVRDTIGVLPLLAFVAIKKPDQTLKKIILVSLGYIFLLSFYHDRFGWYLLPIYPLIAIAFGKSIDRIDKKKSIVILMLFVSQILVFSYLKNLPDNSFESAVLGSFIKDNFKNTQKVYFQGNDFPSVIYYSGREQINLAKGLKIHPGDLMDSVYLVSKGTHVEFPLIPKKMIPAPFNYQVFQF